MLTDTGVKALRPRDRPYKQGDSSGLYLLVTPAGGRLWRLNYMRAGRQKTLALGAYPEVSLADARRARDAAKIKLRDGIDPVAAVQVEKTAARAAVTTFAMVADEWFTRKMTGEHKAHNTVRRARRMLVQLNAGIGDRPIGEIEAPDLLAVLRRVEAAGHHEETKRLRATASTIFRFGIAIGACKRDVAGDLKGALTSRKSRPRSAIVEPSEVGKLLRAIDDCPRLVVRRALQLLALVFVRPSELVLAEWSEFDLDGGVWVIPGSRMKMRKEFHIPLPRQALAIVVQLRKEAGAGKFVFPSVKRDRPLQPGKLTEALRAMGYAIDEVSAHGFRSMASTLLNDEGDRFSPDVIELCLAHAPRGVRSIYNRSTRWSERVMLMSWWGNRLDELRGRGEVVKLVKMLPKKRRK